MWRQKGVLFLMLIKSIMTQTVGVIPLCSEMTEFDGNELCCHETYDKRQLDVEPKTVDAWVDFKGVTEVDNDQATISIKIEMFLGWVDSRLKVTNSFVNETNTLKWYRVVDQFETMIWSPPIGFQSIRSFSPTPSLTSMRSKTFWMLVADQYFEVSESFELKVTCNMDFNLYPFDTQSCPILFGDNDYETESLLLGNLTLYYHGISTTFGQPEILLDFTNGAYDIYVEARASEVFKQLATGEEYSYTGLNIKFKRKPFALMGSFYAPTILFVGLSWLSFQIPVNQVPGRMGLLITLFLIMVNTYGNTVAESPPNRGFGLLELWMLGAQMPVFFAMIQYGYILYKVKRDHGPNCPLRAKNAEDLKKRKSSYNPRLATARTIKVSPNLDPDYDGENDSLAAEPEVDGSCCPNKRFKTLDRNSELGSIFGFILFNVMYWSWIAHIVKKQEAKFNV